MFHLNSGYLKNCLIFVVALITLTACRGGNEFPCGTPCSEGSECDTNLGSCVVKAEEACVDGEAWEPGEPAFEDVSDEWGLDEIGANGQRLSVTDLDGDGWPDLSVRRAGTTSGDDFSSDSREDRVSWLLKNDGGEGFEDVTQESGLVQSRSGGEDEGRPVDTIIWADVDNDGDLDAYTSFNRQNSTDDEEADTAEVMLNDGDGNFEFADDDTIRRLGEPDSPGGASFTDVDRDGNVDLWVTQYADANGPLQDRLYLGDGEGGFEEATEEAGLQTEPWENLDDLNEARAHSVSWGANACDLNDDGTPELLAASYGRAPNHLWLGELDDDGNLSYENHSIDSGYAFDDRTDWTDNESARCYCKHNPDAEDCDGVPEPEHIACEDDQDLRWNHDQDREPFRLGGNSGTTVCADLNNERLLDLLTTEIRHWDVGSSSDPSEILYNEGGDGLTFDRRGREATGLTREHDETGWDEGDITAAVFDFDNDNRQDIYIGSTDYPGTRGHLYYQKEDFTFEEVSLDDGIDHTSSHGVAVADFDRDGDLDVAVGHSRNRCSNGDHCYSADEGHVRLFENTAGDDQNWVQIELVGDDETNRAAIGAQIDARPVRAPGEGFLGFEVDGGHGHYGIQHDRIQHIGLGDACYASVTVRWPDEELTEQDYTLRAGHRYRWKQGEVPTVVE